MHDRGSATVAVIIVNFNGGDCLSRCLACLAAQSVLPTRIVVIDNGSTDGSAETARHLAEQDSRLAPRTLFHMAGENLGFATANNRAVKMCDDEFVAVLNPDAFPEAGWLSALLDAARDHPDTAAFGSRQMLAGTPDLIDGLGDVYHISGLSWRAGHGCRLTAADHKDAEIFSPCAAAALYRKAAFDDVGGFDEDFFCYFEDVDLGFRLRLAGYRARYISRAVVCHLGGESAAAASSEFAVFHGHRNLVWCFFKNMPQPIFVPSLLAHFLQTILILAFSVPRGHFRTIVKAKWHAVAGLSKCLRKRRIVQRNKRVTATALGRWLDMSLCRRRCSRRSPL